MPLDLEIKPTSIGGEKQKSLVGKRAAELVEERAAKLGIRKFGSHRIKDISERNQVAAARYVEDGRHISFIGIRTLCDRVTRGYGDHSPLTTGGSTLSQPRSRYYVPDGRCCWRERRRQNLLHLCSAHKHPHVNVNTLTQHNTALTHNDTTEHNTHTRQRENLSLLSYEKKKKSPRFLKRGLLERARVRPT